MGRVSARVCEKERRRGARGKKKVFRSPLKANKSGDGIRAAIAGWSPPGSSSQQSGERSARGASPRTAGATAGAAGGCGDFGFSPPAPPGSTNLLITLTLWDKEQRPETGLARLHLPLASGRGPPPPPQLVCERYCGAPF